MTYQEQSDRYRAVDGRGRYEMCIREQAHATFTQDEDPANKALADSVIGGNASDVDALIAAICVGPNSADLDDDGALLGAVQLAWPVTASAMYSTL
jgi:hypothetical protein